ncbi:hypothetical protein [Streptomyces sp. NPDC059071]|uniref:hypothetical protein n=1 Tax=unclassified Streptomyces TaxID=2593676 RepID=UPI00362CFEB3
MDAIADAGTVWGPMERVDGRWVLGDARKPDGSWVELRPDGLFRHAPAVEDELVPWARIMIGPRLYIGRGLPREGNVTLDGLLNGVPPFKGRGRGHLDMTLRHPYEDHRLTFHLHARGYSTAEVTLLDLLFTTAVADGRAARLGDADWLGRVVARLPRPAPWEERRMREAVTAALGTE